MAFNIQDHYYKQAKKDQYLARSIYKLQEIDDKYFVYSNKKRVLDIGYYPGSWMQFSLQKIKDPKAVFRGIDVADVQTNLSHEKRLKLYQLPIEDLNHLDQLDVDSKFDLLVSDMAPNTTGIKHVDQLRSLNLIEEMFHRLPMLLENGGDMVFKIFDGNEAQQFIRQLSKYFDKILKYKPKSTRKTSKEFYVIGKSYLGLGNQ
jgi:23S rRNA (uridine2552-2'-O)-methyltransferase